MPTYLLEKLCDNFITINDTEIIEEYLNGVNQKDNILRTQPHSPGDSNPLQTYKLNPGSVGLPAYDEDSPVYHKVENFSNYAQYCIADITGNEIRSEQISIPYEF